MIDRQRTAPEAVPRSYRAAFGCISDAPKVTAEVEHFIPVNVGLCRRALMRATTGSELSASPQCHER